VALPIFHEARRGYAGARNWPDVAQNGEKIASETRHRLHNSRECRANFCQRDMAHRDGTAWLGWEDSNSEMSWQNPFERSHRFPVIQPDAGRRDYSRSSCDGGRRSSGRVPGSQQTFWRGALVINNGGATWRLVGAAERGETAVNLTPPIEKGGRPPVGGNGGRPPHTRGSGRRRREIAT